MPAFNLITTPWLEVRRASGARQVICPYEITDGFNTDPILALDFPRPDWNTAVTEWLIGMMFLSSPPEGPDDWAERFEDVPSPATLQAELAPLVPYFNLDGDGPRAFQDFETLANQGTSKSCSYLLIDSPGENPDTYHSDLFVKRQDDLSFSICHAAAALITLQTYAPQGGSGHLTSLRGGGPLTILLAPIRKGGSLCTLWDCVWANTPELDLGAVDDPQLALPWLKETVSKALVTQDGQHPALAFFACPRRIRLEFEDTSSGYRVARLRTLKHGTDYQLWTHPLSPHDIKMGGGKSPVHPKSEASSYGDWIGWLGCKEKAAPTCLALWDRRRVHVKTRLERTLVLAFGYEMDKAKAKYWLDAHLPWVSAHEGDLRNGVSHLVAGAEKTAKALQYYVALALFGQRNDKAEANLKGKSTRGEKREFDVDQHFKYLKLKPNLPPNRFWQETEPAFRLLLDRMIEGLGSGNGAATSDLKREWLGVMRGHALRIFDDIVDMDGLTNQEPRRLIYARGQLQLALSDGEKGSVLQALGLDSSVKPQKSPPAKSRRA